MSIVEQSYSNGVIPTQVAPESLKKNFKQIQNTGDLVGALSEFYTTLNVFNDDSDTLIQGKIMYIDPNPSVRIIIRPGGVEMVEQQGDALARYPQRVVVNEDVKNGETYCLYSYALPAGDETIVATWQLKLGALNRSDIRKVVNHYDEEGKKIQHTDFHMVPNPAKPFSASLASDLTSMVCRLQSFAASIVRCG